MESSVKLNNQQVYPTNGININSDKPFDFENYLPKFLKNLNFDDDSEDIQLISDQEVLIEDDYNLEEEILFKNNRQNFKSDTANSESEFYPRIPFNPNRPNSSRIIRQFNQNLPLQYNFNNNVQFHDYDFRGNLLNIQRHNFTIGNNETSYLPVYNPINRSFSNNFKSFGLMNLNNNKEYPYIIDSANLKNHNSLDYDNSIVKNNSHLEHPKRFASSENVSKLEINNRSPTNSTNCSSRKSFKIPIKHGKSSFFNNKEKNIQEQEEFETFDELIDKLGSNLNNFVRTQKGSRVLQKLLDKIFPENIDILLEHLKGDFVHLMTDTYGNYLCQKLFQCCSSNQRKFILQDISHDFIEIACHPSGTHSLQTLIELINTKEEEHYIRDCIYGNELKLAVDNNGTHVMQKIISCINENNRQQLNNEILLGIQKLVIDSNGICVLKKFVNGNESEIIKECFIKKIMHNTLNIVQNPFGNYIIQHVLEQWGIEYCKNIFTLIVNNVLSLSMQKFSSNVVEKCFGLADELAEKK